MPVGRAAGRAAVHAELLAVGVARGRVAVVEDDLEVAVGKHDGVGSLVEVARRAAWRDGSKTLPKKHNVG